MGKIIYTPHCASCGREILEQVVYSEYTDPIQPIQNNKSLLHVVKQYSIKPMLCKGCGEHFDTIEVMLPEERIF